MKIGIAKSHPNNCSIGFDMIYVCKLFNGVFLWGQNPKLNYRISIATNKTPLFTKRYIGMGKHKGGALALTRRRRREVTDNVSFKKQASVSQLYLF